MRGLLATYVVLGHARWLLWEGHDAWNRAPHGSFSQALEIASASLRYGHEAVIVFFVLSGFFIHLTAARALATRDSSMSRFSAGAFFRRRFWRLAPPYAFALLVTIVADIIGRGVFPALYAGSSGDPLLDETFARTSYHLSAILPALLILPSSLGRAFGSNAPLWSLAYEVLYYLIYPLWLALRQRSAWFAYGLAAPLAGLASWQRLGGAFAASVVQHYPVWLAGAAIAEIFCRRNNRGQPVILIAQLLLGVSALALSDKLPFGVVQLFLDVIGGASLVSAFAGFAPRASEFPPLRVSEWLGMRSYTIYICHFPLLALACAAVFHSHGQRPAAGWIAIAGAALVLLCCTLFFQFCERPFLRPNRIRHEASMERAALPLK